MKKIISGILAFSILISILLVPVSAVTFPDRNQLIYDSQSISAWNSWIDINATVEIAGINGATLVWTEADKCMASAGVGLCDSLESLQYASVRWNGVLNSGADYVFQAIFAIYYQATTPKAEVAFDSDLGVYRLREKYTNLWIVNSSGHFPYYRPESPDQVEHIGQWCKESAITANQALWHVVIGSDLSAYKENWADDRTSYILQADGEYYWLVSFVNGVRYVLCDDYGYPYYVPIDKQTAVTTPNNYYTEEGDTVNVYDGGSAIVGSIVDVQNGILNVGGQAYYIDDLTYDASSKTYFVDSHDAYTYNQTTNNYTTNNYHWEIQYNIDYTSVTYIGQTEEYEEEYRYYYQLPDGRSSADLTAEDLEQLSVSFTDVVNYARSADNANLRALYHFDGNTQDSSYWSYCTDFKWNSGASLTYMDEGTFGGSLYLDETEHDFTVTLPNILDVSGDFTFQFRYYQSYTADPYMDSYIKLGGQTVLQIDGVSWCSSSGSVFSPISVGNWNEICLLSSGGTLYYYINGVPYGSVSDLLFSGGTITFHFGSDQQTYKKLDELRFSRGAIYTPGENYECSSVPFDTNLTLILPDGERPMADEVVVFVSENNILSRYNVHLWSDPDFISNLSLYAPPDGSSSEYLTYYSSAPASYSFFYNSSYTTISEGVDGISLSCTGTDFLGNSRNSSSGKIYYPQTNGFFLPLSRVSRKSSSSTVKKSRAPDLNTGVHYCYSVVLADGSFSSISFLIQSDGSISDVLINNQSDLSLYCSEQELYSSSLTVEHMALYGIFMFPKKGKTCEIVYTELVEGTEPQYEITYETAMYSSGELDSSPVLAVRSNQPISGYQIGGVRPSYPTKGLVWAMVENGRISSLQQYSGTAWIDVDGRIWTGVRWIPYYSFDVFLLKDCYDLQGTVTGDDYEYIYSESGFWAWFQRQWLAFMAKVDQILDSLRSLSGPGSSDLDDDGLFPSEGDSPGIVQLLVSVKDGLFYFVTGLVSAGFESITDFTVSVVRVTDLFDAFDESNVNGIFIPVEEGSSVWD